MHESSKAHLANQLLQVEAGKHNSPLGDPSSTKGVRTLAILIRAQSEHAVVDRSSRTSSPEAYSHSQYSICVSSMQNNQFNNKSRQETSHLTRNCHPQLHILEVSPEYDKPTPQSKLDTSHASYFLLHTTQHPVAQIESPPQATGQARCIELQPISAKGRSPGSKVLPNFDLRPEPLHEPKKDQTTGKPMLASCLTPTPKFSNHNKRLGRDMHTECTVTISRGDWPQGESPSDHRRRGKHPSVPTQAHDKRSMQEENQTPKTWPHL
jgi:hypothetical protein